MPTASSVDLVTGGCGLTSARAKWLGRRKGLVPPRFPAGPPSDMTSDVYPEVAHLQVIPTSGMSKTPGPAGVLFMSVWCPRGDLNPHPLMRGLAPQASASTYSATRT